MRIIHSLGHVVGGTLLIAGTAVGVGMLALPIATGPGGFLPSVTVYLICWAFMLCTGLLLVEVSLWMPKDTSFISMAEKILGTPGRIIFWIVYLFLFISVMIAHASGGGAVLSDILGWNLPLWASTVIYTCAFAPVVYLGAHSVDRLNLILISGVILTYLGFVVISYTHVDINLLKYANWGKACVAFPILFTAFTYHVIIPTLMTYMERNVKKIRLAIFCGSSIPLVIYIIWEVLILGIIPVEGPGGLIEANQLGENAVAPLKQMIQNPFLFTIGKYFAFFSLTTSFIPLALSFVDFLADGLKWKKKGVKKIILCLLVFGVPLIIALQYPHIFLIALSYAGGISCALLFGLMPPLLVWIGRYVKRYPTNNGSQLFGGKPILVVLMGFALLILSAQVIQAIL